MLQKSPFILFFQFHLLFAPYFTLSSFSLGTQRGSLEDHMKALVSLEKDLQSYKPKVGGQNANLAGWILL